VSRIHRSLPTDSPMSTHTFTITRRTRGNDHILDITDNGQSHVRASLIGPSVALPVVDGRVPLGTWQQIILMDFDTRPRERTVVVNVVGAR